jgi:hypothetical protein
MNTNPAKPDSRLIQASSQPHQNCAELSENQPNCAAMNLPQKYLHRPFATSLTPADESPKIRGYLHLNKKLFANRPAFVVASPNPHRWVFPPFGACLSLAA